MAVQLPSIESIPLVTPQADQSPASFGGAEAATRELAAAASGMGAGLKNQADFVQGVLNENRARDASVALGAKMGDIWSKYSQLQGQAAVQGYPDFISQIQQARQDAVGGMPNLETQNMLGQQATYMVDRWQLAGGAHSGQQAKAWTEQSHLGQIEHAANQAVLGRNDPDEVARQLGTAVNSSRDLSTLTGADPDTTVANTARDAAKVVGPVVDTLAAENPAAAQAMFDRFKDQLPAQSVAAITERLKAGVRGSAIAGAAHDALAAPLPAGGATPSSATVDQLNQAFQGQEGVGTSVQGAVAGIMPATFKQFAQPGQDINNAADNAVVRLRMIAKYAADYPGDAARVAVALFSGPGNVAPAGSPTPWLNDAKDALGTSTSQYVAGFLGRIAPAPGAPAGQPASADHNPAAYGAEFQRMQQAWTTARERFPNDALAQHQMVDIVWSQIQQTNTLQAKYEAEQAKATRDAQEASGQTFIKQILTDPTKFDPAALAADPALTWVQKNDLSNIAQAHLKEAAGGRDSQTYGPGFWDAYQKVHSSDPATKINDPSQLWSRGGPNGDLSLAGIDKLTQEITSSRTPEGASYADTVKTYLAAAHVAISGHGMMGGQRDAVGEMNFARFMPAAFGEIDKERQAGMTPGQMMAKDGALDKLVQQFKRSPAQMMKDMLGDNNPDLPVAAGDTAATTPAKADLTTQQGITAAYKSGFFGIGPAAYDRATAELTKRGFVKGAQPAAPAAASPAVPTND